MSFYKIAQDYFNSPKYGKLPQDFKSSIDFRCGLDIHSFTLSHECLYHPNKAYAIANSLTDLDSTRIIEHYTMFMLFSSIAANETEWIGE